MSHKSEKSDSEKFADRRISEMHEAELLKFLRETALSLAMGVERLEILSQREDEEDGGQDASANRA